MLVLGCSSPAPAPRVVIQPPLNSELERTEFEDPAWATHLFSVARSALNAPVGDDAISAAGDETVIVCAHRRNEGESVCWLGGGASVEDATRLAAAGLSDRVSWGADEYRLTLDLVVHREADRIGVLMPNLGGRDLGLVGIIADWKGKTSFVLPSTILADGMVRDAGVVSGVPGGLLVERLVANHSNVRGIPIGAQVTRIRTAKWVEPIREDDFAHRLYRLHSYDQRTVDEDLLRSRILLAADHLTSTVEADGRIRYLYDPRTATEGPGYNLLRHAGTTYSMLQAYERIGDPVYLEAVKRAISYLFTHTRSDERQGPYGGGESLYVVEGDDIKLGGAGLALLMLVEYMDATVAVPSTGAGIHNLSSSNAAGEW